LALEAAFPSNCHSMMGLHPCSVRENVAEELSLIEHYLAQRRFIGVGEIGLDFYWDLTFKDQQYQALHRQLELALQYDLPVSIHSRNATDECIEAVKQHQNGKLRGSFHCFSGTRQQAGEIIAAGMFLGIGGVLTFKNAGLDKEIRDIGLEYMVLETDSPYLAPVPYRGKRNESAYIPLIAQKLADVKEISVEEVAKITTANAEKLFGL
jgi:TatD DNase family protein